MTGDIKARADQIIGFLRIDIWKLREQDLPAIKAFGVKWLKVLLLTWRGFNSHDFQLRASSLTFYTVLSIVPLVALAFGISKGFGFEKILERELFEAFPGQEAVLTRVTDMARTVLEQTRGGAIAGIGLAVLVWAVVKVLMNIEEALNTIWLVKKPRTIRRKFGDYLSIMAICPLLIIVTSSMNVFISTQVSTLTDENALLGFLDPFIFLVIKFLPYGLIWALFSMIYLMMPNITVKLGSGILGGVIAGTVYQLAQWTYIKFQVGVANYNAIYGSFAALPLFLVWIQLSWLIVLLGAQISFAHQNVDTYTFESEGLKISPALRKLLSLRMVHLVVRSFARGDPPRSAQQIATRLEVPINLAQPILEELVDAGILIHIRGDSDEDAVYHPARDIHVFTVKSILDALEHQGTEDIPLEETAELRRIAESLDTFRREMEKSPANLKLTEI